MKQLIETQRVFFNSHGSKQPEFRIQQLKKLKNILKENEARLHKAIYDDFKKSSFENYLSELGILYNEINHACRNLKKWSRAKKVRTNIINFPARSYIVPQPLGVVLVISTWNYPYNMSLVPVIGAIAAGCCVVLKPSEHAAHSSRIMAELVNKNFDAAYFKVIEGGIPHTSELLKQKFDKIFFTGSVAVGKIIYQAAANNLTPVTLELGGKTPAIFTENCNLKMSIKRMIWAKYLNAGQTCIAPDYLLVPKSIRDAFLRLAVAEIERSHFSFENDNWVQIINGQHFDRLIDLLNGTKIHYGGSSDKENRFIEPTIITDVHFDDKIMQDEVFGPILPVIEYDDLDAIIGQINSRPRPLTCYVFTNDKKVKNKIIHQISFGGGAVNDSVMQFTNNNLPFGGVGDSGSGSYHGEYGFRTFSHYKSILDKPAWFELNLKYYPHTKFKLKWLKRLLG